MEPDWQNDGGHTALFLDKSGYLVEEGLGNAVRDRMLAWSDETKKAFTGQYRLEDLTWAGSYTGIGEGYIDVFTAPVWYEAVKDADLTGIIGQDWIQKDGWVQDGERLAAAVCHDGSEVTEKLVLWIGEESSGGTAMASRLAQERRVPLTAAERKELEAYFNDRENNGLLRFEMDPDQYKGCLLYTSRCV